MRLPIILACLLTISAATSQPTINNISPATGPTGTSVTINGSGFNPVAASNVVRFGSGNGTVTAASPNSLSVIVSTGNSPELVTVTSNGLTGYANAPFITTIPGGNGPFTVGSFAAPVNLATSPYPYDIVSGDLDGDNKPEIITGSFSTNLVSVHKNASVPGTISFPNRMDLVAGNSPSYLALGDIDGNGLLDIVAANTNDNSLCVFLNTSSVGSLSFAPKVTVASGGNLTLAVNDIDGDGKPDIIITRSYTMAVLRNLSTPGAVSFATPILVATTSISSFNSLAVLDVNANGKPDIITLVGGAVTVFSNTSVPGSISFTSAASFTLGTLNPFTIAAGNLDDDGKPDIAVSNINSSSISVLKNTGTGSTVSFAAPVNLLLGWNPSHVKIADTNGDGKQDLVVGEFENSKMVTVLRNTSTNILSFDPRVTYATGGKNWRLTVSDLDGDGQQDVASIQTDSSRIVILRNRIGGQPSITSFTPLSSGEASNVTIIGKNLAGTNAVSFGGVAASSFAALSDTLVKAVVSAGASGNVAVVTPAGTVSAAGFVFSPRPLITSFTPLSGPVGQRVKISGSNFSTVAANNIVRFGSVQATVVSASATALYVDVPPGTTYQPISVTVDRITTWTKQPFNVTFSAGVVASSIFSKKFDEFKSYSDYLGDVATSDFDGDGRTDMIVGNNMRLAVYRNTTMDEALSFAPRAYIDGPPAGYIRKLVVADFDGDGKPDLLVTGYIGTNGGGRPTYVFFYKNTSTIGNISLLKQDYFQSVGSGTWDIGVRDLDGDGRPDVVAPDDSYPQITVLRNTSTPTAISFGSPQVFPTRLSNIYSLSIGDIDGDAKPDIFAGHRSDTMSYCIFRNTSTIGSISLAPRMDFAGMNVHQTLLDDLNGDGKLELITGNEAGFYSGTNWTDSSLSIIQNLSTPGNIVLGPRSFIKAERNFGLQLSDIDGDGRPDLVTQNGGTYSVLKNNSSAGSLSLAPKVDYNTFGYAGEISGFKVGDLDGDSKPDIAMVKGDDSRIFAYINQNNTDIQLCPNGSATIRANLVNYPYQWQLDTGNGFIPITNNLNYSGTDTAVLQLSNIPSSWYGYRYRCKAGTSFSKIFTIRFTNEWIGLVSTSWEEPGNWSCGTVPDLNTDVTIKSGSVVLNSDVTVNRLHLDADVFFLLLGGHRITIRH